MVLVGALVAGCDLARFIGFMFAPDISKKVAADCKDLDGGQTVAIVVAVTPGIDHENPGIPMDLSMRTGQQLAQNVKKLQVLDPLKVVMFQRANLGWRDVPRNELAERLGATHVLCITVNVFSTVDAAVKDLGRGTMEAEVGLYTASKTAPTPVVWRHPGGSLKVSYPGGQDKDINYTLDSPETVRVKLIDSFSDELAKKFYDHEAKGENRR
jgi:hypothetical protein